MQRSPLFLFTRIASLSSIGLVCACARGPDQLAANDPGEPTNRAIFGANMFIDRHALKPVARTYVAYVPHGVRSSVHSFVANLGEPVVLVNDLAQGNFSRSWNTSERFVINTTVGGLGLFDVAKGWGMPYHNADFGQTLGVWGVGTGPQVQLPLFGFSNVRDTVGKAVGLVTNPASFASGGVITAVSAAGSGLGVIDGRAGTLSITDDVEKTSLDKYATLRSMTEQRRAVFVEEGKIGKVRTGSQTTAKSKPDSSDRQAVVDINPAPEAGAGS